MRTRKTLPLIAATVLLAACGGGDDETAQTTAGEQPGAAVPSATTTPGAATDTGMTAGAPATPGAPVTAPGATAQGTATPAPAAGAAGAAGGSGAGNAQLVQQGQQIFASGVCVSCHGANAEGGPLGPNLRDSEWLWIQPGANMQTQVVTLIRTGVSQPKQYPAPMPPMGGMQLSEEQLNALAAYIISISSS